MSAERVRMAVVVGAKGKGSNMLAIARAASAPDFPAQLIAVVTPDASSPAAVRASEEGIEVRVIDPAQLADALADIELVCLAGYMRKVPPEVVARFEGAMLNIHPSLLPKFGGKGMYGRHVHEAVLAAGESESGCTVHLVTAEYDEGAVLIQRTCPVEPTDTPESLAGRVQALEHVAYPEAICRWAEARGRI